MKYPRRRVTLKCDPELGVTRNSFKQECDINRIVSTYAETGMVNHLARSAPQYGDAPEQNFFESACISAEIASQTEEGVFGQETPSEAPEEPKSDVTDSDSNEEEKSLQEHTAAEDESSG